uniref:RING-type E3 ubiquitin transferase n=1 Tax=Timema genevievae TaxID=629358 RepID=A0A7R9PNW2_TIMGE|nr:unnamed protein product [Timema genevievae]
MERSHTEEAVARTEQTPTRPVSDGMTCRDLPPCVPRENVRSVPEADDTMTDGSHLYQTLLSIFECPVCLEYIVPPLTGCENGHYVCDSCRPRVRCCPLCRGPIGESRNYRLEALTQELKYPCRNTERGCSQLLVAGKVNRHERSCNYRLYHCPLRHVTRCGWTGVKGKVCSHMSSSHECECGEGGVRRQMRGGRLGSVGGMSLVEYQEEMFLCTSFLSISLSRFIVIVQFIGAREGVFRRLLLEHWLTGGGGLHEATVGILADWGVFRRLLLEHWLTGGLQKATVGTLAGGLQESTVETLADWVSPRGYCWNTVYLGVSRRLLLEHWLTGGGGLHEATVGILADWGVFRRLLLEHWLTGGLQKATVGTLAGGLQESTVETLADWVSPRGYCWNTVYLGVSRRLLLEHWLAGGLQEATVGTLADRTKDGKDILLRTATVTSLDLEETCLTGDFVGMDLQEFRGLVRPGNEGLGLVLKVDLLRCYNPLGRSLAQSYDWTSRIFLLDLKGRMVDLKGRLVDLNRLVDLEDLLVDVKGRMLDFKGRLMDFEDLLVDVKGRTVDFEGHMVDLNRRLVDYEGHMVDLNRRLVDYDDFLVYPKNLLACEDHSK